MTAAKGGPVDQIVMDETGHVHELHGNAGRERRLARCGQEDEQRP
jgi:hypothetical protein